MLMTMAFFSWIFLEKVIDNKHPFSSALLCGLFSGLAIATHLNGVFIAIAGGLVLLIWHRKSLITYIPGLILTSCIYFYDFTPEFGAGFWWYQIAHSFFITISSCTPWGFVLINLLEEQMRFFNSPKEMSFTLLTLFSIYLLWKNKVKINRVKIFYVAAMIHLMGVFSAHKTSKYMLLYFPLFIFIITKATLLLKEKKATLPSWNYKGFMFLVIAYLVANSIFNVNLAFKKQDDQSSVKILNKYIKEDCSTLYIVAPMYYISILR